MRHPSHETRISMDASTYDEICIHCGATDITGGGWGRLAAPCPASPPMPACTCVIVNGEYRSTELRGCPHHGRGQRIEPRAEERSHD